MKIISKEKIQKIFDLISERRILNAKNILGDLNDSKDLEKIIDEDIAYQKKQLIGDYEKDKPIKWRIEGFELLKKKFKEMN